MPSAFHFLKLAIAAIFLNSAIVLSADAQAELSPAQLVGVPVFSADGVKIGQVADVSSAPNGKIDLIRVFTGSALGFGRRIITVPQPAFVIRRGVVTLPDLSAEDVQAFPTTSSESEPAR